MNIHAVCSMVLRVIGALILCPVADACPAPTRPGADSTYPTIILGEVVGVRLTDYAAARQKQISEGTTHAWMSDASAGYEVEVIPIEVFTGSATDLVTLKIPMGCAIRRADLNQFGIFFVKDEGVALPLYQDDRDYHRRLMSLGSQNVSTCTTGPERFNPHPCWKPRQAQLQCLTLVKDTAYYHRSSCPSGVQEFRERLHSTVLGVYDWQMPPVDPASMR